MVKPRPISQRWYIGPLLSLATLLVMIIVAELFLWKFWDDPLGKYYAKISPSQVDILLRPSTIPGLEYELTPNASGRHWATDVEVNSYGMRGKEPESGRAWRVAVVGDSVAFGNVVPMGEEFGSKLSSLLQTSGRDVEVLNFALGGYDVLDVAAVIKYKLPEFEPDLIFWVYSLNDVAVVSGNLEYIRTAQLLRNKTLLIHSRITRYVLAKLLREKLYQETLNANTPEAFRARYAQQISKIDDDDPILLARPNHENDIVCRWYRSLDRLGRLRFAMQEIQDSATAPVTLMVVPLLDYTNSTYLHTDEHQLVEDEAARHEISTVDLLSTFLAEPVAEIRQDDMHPNAHGHQLMAEVAHRWLVETIVEKDGSRSAVTTPLREPRRPSVPQGFR